ncbi:MAG: BamA/TamA family outer membrane protein [Bacteroidota bacterium]
MQLKFFILIFCFPVSVYSQFRIDTARRVNYLAIPILFKTPETGWAYGLSASANFKTSHKNDTLTRTSVITVLGIFSQREQNIQGVDATIYFPKEKYILYFNSSHSYFPDNFWGLGQYSKNSDVERYVFEQVVINPHIKRKFFKHNFFGVLADYQNIFKVQYSKDGLMDSLSFYGKTNYNVFGLGVTASYDTRNSTFWPTKGVFLQTQFTTYNRELASTYSFNKWTAEVRLFRKVFKKHVIACQLYNYYTYGETPYRSMAALGGSGNLRGFYQGRFRDNSMYSAIVEYRAPIFWKISACVFGGVGDVYNQPKNINASSMKGSFGGGLRLSIIEKDKLNLRVDYGYSDNYNKGFYFTIGECF